MPPKYGGGPSCHRCHKTVYQNELRRDPAGCGDYHKSCYVCFSCNKSLDSTKICTHEDEACSKFYGPDKHSPLSLGVCDVGSPSCKCSQDECAQPDPPIGNNEKLTRMACSEKYHYVMKGKVLLIDEQNTMLGYTVQVVQIIKQGNRNLKVGERIELWKRGACQSPDLKEKKEYLFMGQDNGRRYYLNEKSFVKLWPKSKDNKDKTILDDFAAQFVCPN